MTISDFIPPIISKVRHKPNGQPVQEVKLYSSYHEALLEAGGYEDKTLCDMVADKTVIFRDGSKQDVISQSDLFLLAGLTYIGKDKLTVLDFGGACGAHYYEMRRRLKIKLNWIVVETPQMVLSAVSRGLESGELSFRDNLNDLPQIDLVFSSGALQYVPNPFASLNQLLRIKAPHLLFSRMTFNENDEDLIIVQNSKLSDNGVGQMPSNYTDRIISYPVTTMSYNRFNKSVLSKYSPILSVKEDSGSLKIAGNPVIGRGLFYELNQAK